VDAWEGGGSWGWTFAGLCEHRVEEREGAESEEDFGGHLLGGKHLYERLLVF